MAVLQVSEKYSHTPSMLRFFTALCLALNPIIYIFEIGSSKIGIQNIGVKALTPITVIL